jgi:dolichol-phosphate mannosyltransferase
VRPDAGRRRTLSVVAPAYNEAAVLPEFRARLVAALEDLPHPWEVILVDDGSGDGTAEAISSFHAEDPRFKAIHLSRNFGHQIAVTAGLDHASGDAVVVLDADLQDPPELIPRLVAAWEGGAEVVYGRREAREEGYGRIKALVAAAFYRILRRLSDVDIPVDTGDFRLLDRRVVEVLRTARERHRFVRGLSAWAGFRRAEVRYRREERRAGRSKYSLWGLAQLAADGVLSFSTAPLRLATLLGLASSLAAFFLIVWAIYRRLFTFYPLEAIGWASLIIVVLFIGGIQLLMLGILGEYLGRTYEEVKRRPLYVVDRTAGLAADRGADS